jgi:adenine phosphoribosyltransferase
VSSAGRAAVLERFRWVDGHADVWRVLADGPALAAVVEGLAQPWDRRGVTKVVGIESRGLLLGGAVAVALGVGFVAIRKQGTGLLPGPKLTARSKPDYREQEHELRMQDVLDLDDRVLMVDDWVERGSQAAAARQLVQLSGATWLGLSVMVDQRAADARAGLGRVTALVSAEDLGPSG